MPTPAQTQPATRPAVRWDTRWLVVVVVPLYMLLFFVLSSKMDVVRIAHTWGVYSIEPRFSDLYVAPAAVRTIEAGGDPYRDNTFDPLHRPMNYPPIWLAFSGTDLSPAHIRIQAIAMSAACLIALLVFMGPLDLWRGLWVALLGCSPPALLAVQRANTDLLILALLSASLCLMQGKPGLVRSAFGWVLLVATAFLKLFPLAAFVVLVREKGRHLLVVIVVALATGLGCLLLNARVLSQLMANTPQGGLHSYGARGPAFWAAFFLQDRGWAIDRNYLGWMGIIAAAILVVVAAWVATRMKKTGPLVVESVHVDGFRAGAAIYVSTFILGSNFDYRLLFLLLCLPTLFACAIARHPLRRWSIGGLCLIFATMWPNGLFWKPLLATKEVSSWGLVFALSVVFVRVLPESFRFTPSSDPVSPE